MTNTTTTHSAIDPRTGARLRAATPAEVAAWTAQPARHALLRRPVLVGGVLIDEDAAGPPQPAWSQEVAS